MEECQQSENAPAVEPGHLVAEQQRQQIIRSSSTPDVTEPLCLESAQGMEELLQLLMQTCRLWLGRGLYVLLLSTFVLFIFQGNLLLSFGR